MLTASTEFKIAIENDNRNYIIEIDMTLNDGTKLKLNNSDIWDAGLSFEESTSGSNSFDIGGVVISKCKIILNNIYDKFSKYDFFGATFVLYIGLQLSTTKEMIRKGFYSVDEPTYNGSIITLQCLDNMWKFDRPYLEVKTSYPATTGVIIADICLHCGVSLGKANFDNYNFSIGKRPEEEMNCREVISYISQICGCYAKIGNNGAIFLEWYQKAQTYQDVKGGYFDDGTPKYESGDSLDGGNFTDYSSGANYSGGTFEDWKNVHTLFSNSSTKVFTDDILITGIKVLSEKENGYSFLYGKEGYLLVIKDNPFINDKTGRQICDFVGKKMVGMFFRPYEVSSLNDVTAEAGDSCVINDFRGNSYISYITNLSFALGAFETFSCGAETPSRKKTTRYSTLAKTEVEIRRENEEKLSNYDKAVQNMNQIAGNAMGFHTTYDELPDGSRITYMHDKPKLSDSNIIYKQSIDGFFISSDGGKTYTMGFDSNGNVVLNILYAIGIVCDWIRGGTLSLGGDNNTDGSCAVYDALNRLVAKLDKDGVLASKGSIGGWTIGTDFLEASSAIIRSFAGNDKTTRATMNDASFKVWVNEIEKCYIGRGNYNGFGTFDSGLLLLRGKNGIDMDASSGNINAGGSIEASKNIIAHGSLDCENVFSCQKKAYFYDEVSFKGTWTGQMTINGVTIHVKNGLITNAYS